MSSHQKVDIAPAIRVVRKNILKDHSHLIETRQEAGQDTRQGDIEYQGRVNLFGESLKTGGHNTLERGS